MSKKTDRKITRADIILIAAVLFAALIFFIIFRIVYSSPTSSVAVAEISVDGDVVARLDLDTDQDIIITSAEDGFNHVFIEDSKVWVEEANCPNQDCVRQGKISHDGEVIWCAPHRMSVTILGE